MPNLFPSKSFANLESFLHSLSHSSHFTSPNLRASRPGSSCLAQSATMQSYSHRASLSQSRVFLRYLLMNTSTKAACVCFVARRCHVRFPCSSNNQGLSSRNGRNECAICWNTYRHIQAAAHVTFSMQIFKGSSRL